VVHIEKVNNDTEMKKLLQSCKIMLEAVNAVLKSAEMLEKNNNERIEAHENELARVKKSIILSTENARRSGRPPLTDEEIDSIRELIAIGKTQRWVAEFLDVSTGSVCKYAKGVVPKTPETLEKNINEQKETVQTVTAQTVTLESLPPSEAFGTYTPTINKDANQNAAVFI
jgi:hypothetical protein